MFTAGQMVAHLVGDYVLQSDWQAAKKTERSRGGWWACFTHAFLYTLPFLLITRNWRALAFILATHFIIDHWRLARYFNWVKNWMAPKWMGVQCECGETEKCQDCGYRDGKPWKKTEFVRNLPWVKCSKTGYPDDKPAWMAVWLMIITDNTLHLALNGLALHLWK